MYPAQTAYCVQGWISICFSCWSTAFRRPHPSEDRLKAVLQLSSPKSKTGVRTHAACTLSSFLSGWAAYV